MKSLLHNIRFYVLLLSVILSGVLLLWTRTYITSTQLQIIRLEQIYGFVSLIFLYLALLAGPFCYTFRWFPYKGKYLRARRALGVSAFYFAFLHSCIAFFGQLDGFLGLGFLSNSFLFAILVGGVALFILFLLTITSLDIAVEILTFPKWKFLHRFIYLAGILIIIHLLLLGTHFSDVSGIIPQISFLLLACLLLLEAPRIDTALDKLFPVPQLGLSTFLIAIMLGVIYFTIFSPFLSRSGNAISFDIHATHRELAQQALQQSQQNNISNIQGLNGDKTKRYTVSFLTPDNIKPNQDTTLKFGVYDASTGNSISFFRILYAKTMHLIISDSTLSYFSHIHPVQQGNDFVITTQFPQSGLYHLYLDFQPFGGIEQQIGFTLPVGISDTNTIPFSHQPVDTQPTKIFGDYMVTINTHGVLHAQDMTLGKNILSFTIRDSKTKKPITSLKPYLSSFGHLTMINEQTYDFLHVHPANTSIPPPDANGGPTVNFMPIGIYGPFQPGIYRVFAEFNPDNTLFTADFTVKVE